MEDMFDLSDLCAADEDSMLSEFDARQEPQMRSRAYTWPTRPVVASVIDEPSNAGSDTSPGLMSAAGPRLLSADDGERGSRGELQLSPGSGVSTGRKASSRRNAWGNLSYADLITKAIESSPEKRLTLSQIYAWMVSNVPFFSDKGDSNSSAGWKNSIRHNLSLHNRFIRVQNEGTGKSSWWMVNPEAITKLPRKRAGTMDSTTVRRPTRSGKRPGGLKHARSSELHASGNELFDFSTTRGSPLMAGNELPGFDSPRGRANSGASSNSGCSPATLSTPLESDIKPSFTLPPSTWDVLYSPQQETQRESLADIFISDAAARSRSVGRNCSQSPSSHMYTSHHILQPQQHVQQPMFMTNEAYAHGVPVHQPSLQRFAPQSFSPPVGCSVVGSEGYPVTAGYQLNGGGQVYGVGCNGGPSAAERLPMLGELLQDQQLQARSGYMLNTFLTSGGSMTSPMQQGWSGTDAGPGMSSPPQLPQATVASTGGTPLRRPLHVNQRLLLQLLATKPHLARRLQQLLEAKRRQLSAVQQQSPLSPQSVPHPSVQPTEALESSTTMLQQLLTAGGPRAQPLGLTACLSDDDDTFPKDLDMNLLDLQSTTDINCDIEQVINHELSFGDKLDFSFDQLHLDEFDTEFGN